MISDGGLHFIAKQVKSLLKKCGINHMVVAPYHPQINDKVEISNREIKVILEKTISLSKKDWSVKLDDSLKV